MRNKMLKTEQYKCRRCGLTFVLNMKYPGKPANHPKLDDMMQDFINEGHECME